MAIAATQPTAAPYKGVNPGTQITDLPGGIPGAVPPQPAYDDTFEMTPRLRAASFFRTAKLLPRELFAGHRIEKPYFEKRWQRVLHRLFPGGLVQSAFATPKPNLAAEAIPSGPLTRPVDARQWMPNVRFEKGEDNFPVDPGFDGDGDVGNNREHYRLGRIDGNQAITYYVHARQKGEYTVIQYWAYHAQNKFLNTHKHDMELFSVYLKPDAKGKLQPAFLQTDWHGTFTMTPWAELQLDSAGRATVLVDRGAHELRPLRHKDKLPKGATLMPTGIWQDKHGWRPVGLHLKGDDRLVKGQEPVTPLKPGLDPRDAWYPGGNWIAGFKYDNLAVAGGGRARVLWYNPVHPSAFGYGTAVSGQLALPGQGKPAH